MEAIQPADQRSAGQPVGEVLNFQAGYAGSSPVARSTCYVLSNIPVRVAWSESTKRKDLRERRLSGGRPSRLGTHSAQQHQRLLINRPRKTRLLAI
jgi:hypothetical protein